MEIILSNFFLNIVLHFLVCMFICTFFICFVDSSVDPDIENEQQTDQQPEGPTNKDGKRINWFFFQIISHCSKQWILSENEIFFGCRSQAER